MARTDVSQWDADPRQITAPITTSGRTTKPTDVSLSLREVMAAVYRYIGDIQANDGDLLIYDLASKSIKSTPPSSVGPVSSVDGRTGAVTLSDLYLGITAKAADSDLLDGHDSTYFINTAGGQTINGTLVTTGSITTKTQLKIKGTGTGTGNISAVEFHESNGTTRKGYIGDASSSNSDIYLASTVNSALVRIQTPNSGGANKTGIAVGGTTPYVRLYHNGGERLRTTSGGITVTGSGTATDWIATSDRRIKSNIERIDRALHRLRAVTGCTFDKKGASYRMAGVIAQDVEEALPEAVVDGKVKAVSAQAMIGLLVEAVKELEQRVEALQ